MNKELELWQFIASRLKNGEQVMLLVVAESSGSSPGRAGYKMAVAADGELVGSIGGGVMEVSLVEHAKVAVSEPQAVATGFRVSNIRKQVHQRNATNASGMICSGRQIVIFKLLTDKDSATAAEITYAFGNGSDAILTVTESMFEITPLVGGVQNDDFHFRAVSETEFSYQEKLGPKNELIIVGGGHCALSLSELMSKMDFRVRIFDDRPELNTLDKNEFADEITIIDKYESIGDYIESGENTYVVVMTLGYASDEAVIRQLLDRDLKYFGVLGSKAKMAVLMKELASEGYTGESLARIHTPIGLPINSRTPEEIAVSIAAEIIAVKNA